MWKVSFYVEVISKKSYLFSNGYDSYYEQTNILGKGPGVIEALYISSANISFGGNLRKFAFSRLLKVCLVPTELVYIFRSLGLGPSVQLYFRYH